MRKKHFNRLMDGLKEAADFTAGKIPLQTTRFETGPDGIPKRLDTAVRYVDGRLADDQSDVSKS